MRRAVTAAILAIGILVPGIKAVSALQTGPQPTESYVVRVGDTLWEIAGTLPDERDRRAVVADLIELNGLRSPSLVPGQTLKIPAR